MPHFVIEYSCDVERDYDIKKVMQIAFEAGVKSGVMQADDIKVRARPYDHYRLMADGDRFVHVTVFLLAGRTSNQKITVSEMLRSDLSAYLNEITSISVDIRDMNPDCYRKRLLASG